MAAGLCRLRLGAAGGPLLALVRVEYRADGATAWRDSGLRLVREGRTVRVAFGG